MADDKSKKKLAPRRETMQRDEAKQRLEPYYVPDYNRTVMAESVEDAGKKAKAESEAEEDNVTEERDNG